MTPPVRWLAGDDAPEGVLELLRHAPASRGLDPRARERSRRRVAALASLPAAAGAFLWLQHAALGAVLGAVVSTAAVTLPRALSPRPAAPTPVVGAPVRNPAPASRATPAIAVPLEAAPPPVAAGDAQTAPAPRTAVEHDLVREARLLESARALLAADPVRALAELRVHEADFSRGTLALERELLTVDALVRLGRRREAEGRARALRGRAPGSLYEQRLDALLGSGR